MEKLMDKYAHIITPDPQEGGIVPKAKHYKQLRNETEAMIAEAELRKADALERIAAALEKGNK